MSLIDLTGEVFGKLTVISRAAKRKSHKSSRWLCSCECGKETDVRSDALRSGATVSCGCKKVVHNMATHHLYKVYRHMINRCYREKDLHYEDYGGRGIKVCEEWQTPKTFLDWAVKLWTPGLQLDREDNDKGYSPGNCRFVTPQTNCNNKRIYKCNSTGYAGVIPYKGKFRANLRCISAPLFGKLKYFGCFDTAEEAVTARNDFIKEHNLPHKIQELL